MKVDTMAVKIRAQERKQGGFSPVFRIDRGFER